MSPKLGTFSGRNQTETEGFRPTFGDIRYIMSPKLSEYSVSGDEYILTASLWFRVQLP